eukprot:tig00000093_g3608.t1
MSLGMRTLSKRISSYTRPAWLARASGQMRPKPSARGRAQLQGSKSPAVRSQARETHVSAQCPLVLYLARPMEPPSPPSPLFRDALAPRPAAARGGSKAIRRHVRDSGSLSAARLIRSSQPLRSSLGSV